MESQSWSKNEVMALIEIWSDDAIQSQLEGMKRNKRVFERISQELSRRGITRSFEQCRNKVKSLKTEYKKMKDNNNRSGQKRISCRYAQELEAILGGKPSTRPKEIVDTSHELSESEDGEEVEGPDNTSMISENRDSDHEDINSSVDAGQQADTEAENNPVPDRDEDNATPQRRPNVHRRPKSNKQKSVADAISLLAEAQVKSDEMFMKLEERRMKWEMESEERRERMRMEFEDRRLKEQHQLEMKRMETMMLMSGRTSMGVSSATMPQAQQLQATYNPMPSSSRYDMPSSSYMTMDDGQRSQHYGRSSDQGDMAYNIADSIRFSVDTDYSN